MTQSQKTFLAVDLGASSGRVLAGRFNGSTIALDLVHRFPNGGVRAGHQLQWNMLGLWDQILEGLHHASEMCHDDTASVGIDTWGVDFGLLSKDDELISNPVHYRDDRTVGMMEKAFTVVDRDAIFEATGLQFMPINTLYQLFAMKQQGSALLDAAASFLMIPDLFHFFLTGEKAVERSNASTTQLFDPRHRDWSKTLLDAFGLPKAIFGELVDAGTQLGTLRGAVAEATGLGPLNVVVPGTHDTASAVMAVPASAAATDTPQWCYISSGTWSLMGVETLQPVINTTCRALNFTNEGGVGGTTRLLKNIAGLWLLQECRRIWARDGHDHGWDDLVRMANEAPPFVGLIAPDNPDFVSPDDMPKAIAAYCGHTGQPVPTGEGAIIRCVMESLALRYREVLASLEEITGSRINTIHIVGGGVQNRLLCQMTADACQRRVLAGPIEATAIGNVMIQAVTAGEIGSISEAREVIRHSFEVHTYTPHNAPSWDEAFERFERLGRVGTD